jgi:hypothetical protein
LDKWKSPPRKNPGLFTDMRLFKDALLEAKRYDFFTKNQIKDELTKKVKGLINTGEFTNRNTDELFRELIYFDWFRKEGNNKLYSLTDEGIEIISVISDDQSYKNVLLSKLQDTYTIPGWMIDRLWKLNSKRQGEIVIPAPLKEWSPNSEQWDNNIWNDSIECEIIKSFDQCNRICPGSIPIDRTIWIDKVRKSWERLSEITRRRKGGRGNSEELMETYQPRRRLANAMKEATIDLLFGEIFIHDKAKDIDSEKPLSLRTYMVWCPRLAELGLLWYTDSYPGIPGRLIYPVSVFRDEPNENFIPAGNVVAPDKKQLFFHSPLSNNVRFADSLYQVHHKIYLLKGTLYVSIFDVRDEICRKLRISAIYFDKLLSSSLNNNNYSIAIETDIREDQKSGSQQLRRPVFINGIPYSLIAITKKNKEN